MHHQHSKHLFTRSAFEVADPTADYGVRPVGVLATPNNNNITHHEWVMEMLDRGVWVPIRPPVRLRNRDYPEYVASRPWLRVVAADCTEHDAQREAAAEQALRDGYVTVNGRRYTLQVLPGLRVKVIPDKGKVLVYDLDAFVDCVANNAMLA